MKSVASESLALLCVKICPVREYKILWSIDNKTTQETNSGPVELEAECIVSIDRTEKKDIERFDADTTAGYKLSRVGVPRHV